YIQAYQRFAALSGGGVNDPAELQRLVTKTGVLDFRIAVGPSEIGGYNSPQYLDVQQSLLQKGSEIAVTVNGSPAKWFEIQKDESEAGKPQQRSSIDPGSCVVARSNGIDYVLCYDDAARSLTHRRPKPWSVRADPPHSDPTQQGGLVLPFRM